MEFKKVVGLIVAMLAVCSAPAISLSAEINDITALDSYLKTVAGSAPGVGTINNSILIGTANSIVSTVNSFVLTSNTSAADPYSLSPQAGDAGSITISGGSLSLYGLNVMTNLSMGNGSILALGSQADNRNFTIGGQILGGSNITVNSAAQITLTNNISASSLTMQNGVVNATGSTVTLSGADGINVSGGTLNVGNISAAKYTQTNGDVSLAGANITGDMTVSGGTLNAKSNAGSTLTIGGNYIINGVEATLDGIPAKAVNASVSNSATLNLKNGASLTTATTVEGGESKISVYNSTIESDGSVTQINAGKTYEQINSTVNVNTLSAGSGGVLIGRAGDAVQDGGGKLVANTVDTSGNFEIAAVYDEANDKWSSEVEVTNVKGAAVVLNGGSLKATNLGTLTGTNAKRIESLTHNYGQIEVENVYSSGNVTLGSGIAPAGSVVDFTSTGNINIENGNLSVSKASGDSETRIQFNGDVLLGEKGNYTQSGGAIVQASNGINAGGNITIDGASVLDTNGGINAGGSYTQTGAGTTVNIMSPGDDTATNVIFAKEFVLGDSARPTQDAPVLNLYDRTGVSGEKVTIASLGKIVSQAGATTSVTIKGDVEGSQYAQGGNSEVNISNLLVTGTIGTNPLANALFDSGRFTAKNIGSNSATSAFNNITIGNGASSPEITVDNMYAWNTITLSSGNVVADTIRSLGNTSNEGGSISISGGTLNIKNLYANGDYLQQNGGIVNVADNGVLSARKSFSLGESSTNKITLGTNAKIETTGTSSSAGNIVLTEGSIVSTGAGTAINAGYNYTQSAEGLGTSVSVDSISAGNNININRGNTTAKTITVKNNGTYTQALTDSGTINVNTNDINAYNIVIGGKATYGDTSTAIDGGTLNLGDGTNPSYLSAKNTIKIAGTNEGTTLNFKNTTFKATTQSQGAGSSAVTIDGVKVNFSGNSNIGAYTDSKGDTQIINSVVIGSDTTLNQTLLNIGSVDDNTSVLTVTAGDRDVLFGSNLATTNYGTLNLNSTAGNINFDSGSKLTHLGTMNLAKRDNDTSIYLSNINSAGNTNGIINNNGANAVLNLDAKVYANKYTQNSGKTTFCGSESTENYNIFDIAENISIKGGSLEFNGTAQVTSKKDFTMAGGTSIIANSLTSDLNSINAENILIGQVGADAVTITMNENSKLTFKPTTSVAINNVTSTMAKGSSLTVDTSAAGSSALLNSSNITLNDTANLNINGNTNVNNSQISLAQESKLNINSTSGNIGFDENTRITNAGQIVVSGDNNVVSMNGSINDVNRLQGNITKTGKNTLNINDKVYGGSLNIENGTTNVNADILLNGNVNINGSKTNVLTATVNVADGKSISTSGLVSVGSMDDYDYTHLTLGEDSKLSGSSVTLNAIIDMTKSTIEATAADGSVTIGQKSNINVHKSGVTPTISTIKGATINILGGSVITIEEGARLVYEGNVIKSSDAHYDVLSGATWQAGNGKYTNAVYTGSGAILNNEGTVSLLGGTSASPMEFTGSYASVKGGAAYNTGTITLYDNVSFTENKSAGDGGAIYNTGVLTVNRYAATDSLAQYSKFHNNKAGFDNNGNILSAYDARNGGAIYNGEGGTVLLGDNSSFTSNVATGEGGAIYNSNSANAITIGNSSRFEGNIAFNNGGAIASDAGIITIGSNSMFSSNSAGVGLGGKSNPVQNSDGGAINIAENSTVILGGNATFKNNYATRNGGAISNEGTLKLNGSSKNDSDFSVNFVANDVSGSTVSLKKGGAVYNKGTIITTDESGSEINGFYRALFGSDNNEDGNTAGYGGAVYNEIAEDAKLVINNSTFKNNKASVAGGAIYNASGTLDIQVDSLFERNTSYNGDGGAIYNADGAVVTLAKSLTFGSNEGGNQAQRGGAIYNAGSLKLNADEDNKINFVGNDALSQGGAIYNSSNDLDLKFTNFIKNTAGAESANKAGQGGALYNTASGINIDNVNFEENSVSGKNGLNYAEGGAIYNNGSMILGNKVVLSDNKASDNSGDKNAKGGAIYNNGSLTLTPNNGSDSLQIQGNTAIGKGGGIYNSKNGNILLYDLGNTVIGGKYDDYITNSVPEQGNTADKGGGIYNEGIFSFAVPYTEGSKGSLYFIGNKATTAGGGLYNVSNNEGYIFPRVLVPREDSETLDERFISSIFYGNTVNTGSDSVLGYGGGLYNEKNGKTAADSNAVYLTKSHFSSNSADIGSAIYNTGKMYLSNSVTFEDNKKGSAIGNEGILYLPFAFGISGNAGAIWNQKDGIIHLQAVINGHEPDNEYYISHSLYSDSGYIDNGRGAVSGAGLHLTDNSKLITDIIDTGLNVYKTVADRLILAAFIENIGYQGGALYKDSSVDLTIGGSAIEENSKIWIDSLQTDVNVSFLKNMAYEKTDSVDDNTAHGGAIYNAGKDGNRSVINLKNDVIFKSNFATGKGGAIYNGADGVINFENGFVIGESSQGYSNVAQVGGGAIANDGSLYFKSLPDKRTAYFTYQGGGISIDLGDSGSTNVYNGKGGALNIGGKGMIYTYNVPDKILENIERGGVMYENVFTHNESLKGGAIYSESEEPLNIIHTQFAANRGYEDGGALYTSGNASINLYLDAGNSDIFTGNQAGNTMGGIASSGKGGAIYNAGNHIAIYSGKFSSTPGVHNVFVSNTAIGSEGSGGAIFNSGGMTIYGNTGFYKNSATRSGGAITNGGSLTLDINYGDIVFDNNTAQLGSAIFMDGSEETGASLEIKGNDNLPYSVTFNDADPEKGVLAQTIASTPNTLNAIAIRGGRVNFLSDASGYHGSYYQTGGIVRCANKFLNVSDAPIKSVTDGTLIFENGARLVSDDLMISNNELNSKAKVIFNKNDKAKLTDLSALYDNASTNNYFIYGNDEEGYHRVVLRAADVEINDTAFISQDATIGNARNSYAVRNLTLSNGATLGKNITVVGGTIADEPGAALIFGEGALGSEQAGVYLKDYNAVLSINNDKTPLVFGGSIKNDGIEYNSTFNKQGDGLVVISGDVSGYNGKYSQSAGTVQFAKGSKFFGSQTSFVDESGNPSIVGGKLQVDDGTTITAPTTIKLGDDAGFSTSMPSTVDLTGDGGALLSMGDPKLTIEFSKNSLLEVTNNSTVNAQKDEIKIGNENLQTNAVILGGSAQNGGSVEVAVNPNTVFILQNERAASDPSQVGKGGILGFGSNVNFKDASGNKVVPTVKLKDYTQLKFTNKDDSIIDINIDSDGATSWADANGDIVKENKGKITIDGNFDNFQGSLIVKDGEIATNGHLFNGNVKIDLSQIDDNAVAVVNNVINSNDMYIVGDIGAVDSQKSFELTLNNDRGNIELRPDVNSTYSNMYVANDSKVNLNSVGSVNVKDLVIKNSTVNLLAGNMNVLGNMSMGSSFNMMNNSINTLNIANNLTLTGDSNFMIDINPALNESDRIVINGNVQSDSAETRALNISDWNLLSDPVTSTSVYNVFDVKGSVDNVVFTTTKDMLYTPIANYMFTSAGNGSYVLTRTGYTPSAMAVPVAMQVGGYLNQLASYDMAFGNLDTVMTLPVVGYDNQYASVMDEAVVYSPLFIPELEKGLWFRPYGNFEKVKLDNGPDVDNQSYGAFVGGDTPLTELGKGFQGTLSAYAGYTGSHQSFNGISNYQNGGTIGVTGAAYKGGFFSGLTVNVNASGNDSSTQYGNNDFFMLGVGVASKTGYNWELSRGRFIVQPSWLMSYSYINAFSPGHLAGYKIDADGLHGVQLSPQIKLIANLPYGWQPYALFNFRWNIADETKVTINSIDIPDVSVKPYVEYGLGVQKRWGERFTGFGQFLGRGAGRTGVGLNFGFRWTVGSGR